MAIRKFRTGQMSYAASTYVGTAGTLFYDEDTGALRLSDGITPGGSLISYPLASSTQIGGVKLGPGVALNNDGQIIIDPVGLDFSFGDFTSTVGTKTDNVTTYAILSSIGINEDIVIASNGTGDVSVVGEFTVHATNGNLNSVLESVPAFRIKADGQVMMLVPAIDSVEGAVSIVGSATGAFITPGNTGVMLHITGQFDTPSIPSRLYNDAQGSFAAFVARRFNGTVSEPTAVLADEEIMRISGTAHDGTVIPGAGNTRIMYKALGNQTLTNHGGTIELWTTPLNSTTMAKVVTINNADGITSTKFTGPLTGNVTGDVTGSVSGNAGTVTNGVYTTGAQSIDEVKTFTSTIVGSINGNAGTVTNGVYTTDTGTVTNTMLAGSIANNKLANSLITVNGTAIALGASGTVTAAAGTLTGTTLNSTVVTSSLTSVGTLTNLAIASGGTITTPRVVINDGGIRTVNAGSALTIDFAVDSIILWTAPGLNSAITLTNYTAGATVKVILAITTTRDIAFGVAAVGNSSTGATAWNGTGAGSIDVANTAMHLNYTCMSALAAGCYVAVTVL